MDQRNVAVCREVSWMKEFVEHHDCVSRSLGYGIALNT
jgi:hypothetical protein